MSLFEKAQTKALEQYKPLIKKVILSELKLDKVFKKAIKEALK